MLEFGRESSEHGMVSCGSQSWCLVCMFRATPWVLQALLVYTLERKVIEWLHTTRKVFSTCFYWLGKAYTHKVNVLFFIECQV
jgi:hypothetical protein